MFSDFEKIYSEKFSEYRKVATISLLILKLSRIIVLKSCNGIKLE